VDEWTEAYPAVDIMVALHSMRQWTLSNPTKAKTRTGARRAVTGWLSREQNRGGNRGKVNGTRPGFKDQLTYSEEDAFVRDEMQMARANHKDFTEEDVEKARELYRHMQERRATQ